jgi:flagellar biosynthesis protein FliQ
MKFNSGLLKKIGAFVTVLGIAAVALAFYFYGNVLFVIHPAIVSTVMIGLVTALFIAGTHYNNASLRYYSYVLFGLYAGYIGLKYALTRWVHPHYTVQIVYVLGITFLALMLIRALFHTYKKQMSKFEISKIEPLLHLAIVFTVLALGRALIIISFDTIQAPGSFFMKQFGGYNNTDPLLIRTVATDIYLRIYYAIFASLLCSIGFIKKQKSLIVVSLLLVILVLHKVWSLFLGTQGIVDETIANALISGILILSVKAYRKYAF